MKAGLRQSMAWLHSWSGLLVCWVLLLVFCAGTASYFKDEITLWMQPELHRSAATPVSSAEAASHAVAYLQRNAADSPRWFIDLPDARNPAVSVLWTRPPGAPASGIGGGRGRFESRTLDPATGAFLQTVRNTRGGEFLYRLHFDLYFMQAIWARWIIGLCAMFMLVAILSGVITHRRIFQDFFTFRPRKGQRSWLDAHNATAVLALPFLFMIVYTGLAIFYTSYVPLPLHAAYGWDDNAFSRFQGELSPETPLLRPRTGKAAAMHDLAPLLRQARALTGSPASRLIVERPADTSMVIKILGRTPDTGTSRRILNEAGSVTFDGVTGAVLDVKRPDPADAHSAKDIHRVMEQLHLVGFGGWTMKWLYFFSGLSGTAMMATGTLLFTIKRRKKSEHEFGTFTARVYRGIEALNVAAIAGLCIACIAYLYGNRLIPADLPDRATWEIRIFFYAWLATLLHAMIRPPVRAWMAQLSAGALLCLGLPLLNALSTAEQAWTYASRADWERAGVELTVIGFGLSLAFSAWQVRRGWSGRATPAVKT